MAARNLLSAPLGRITHTHLPCMILGLLIVVFAIGNAVLGSCLMWRLVSS